MKWLQVLLFNTNHSIQHYSFICTQSNGSKYCSVISISQFRHTVKEFQVLLFNTNNSIQENSFICTQLNGYIHPYLSLTIHLDSHLFTHRLNVRQFYLTHRKDPIMCNHSGLEWAWEWWQWKGILYYLKLQYWSLTIRLFNVTNVDTH